tara:strand:- start:496 stop:828 length:333 start_codon:yes stop_codon:yes gene_type:complete
MFYYAFKSNYGYNPSVREGKIYFFSSKISMIYLLSINKDLINIAYPIKNFCKMIHKKKFLRKIINEVVIKEKLNVELGKITWYRAIERKLKEINSDDNLHNYLFYIFHKK